MFSTEMLNQLNVIYKTRQQENKDKIFVAECFDLIETEPNQS